MLKRIILVLAAVALIVPSPSYQQELQPINIDDICKNIRNSYGCAQAIERYQQEHLGKYFVRKKGRLELVLINGKKVVLKDIDDSATADPGNVKEYHFRDYIQSIGYFLIHLQYYEGDAYLMINAKTGQKFLIPAPPNLSPDNKRFVSVSASDAYNFNGIKIWKITGDTLRLEWTYEPREYALYSFVAWTDCNTMRLNKSTYIERKEVNIPQLLVKDNSGSWKLVDEMK